MKSFKWYREERRERQEHAAADQKEVLDRIAETAAGFPLLLRRRVRELCYVWVGGFILVGALLGMIVGLYADQFGALISGRQVTYVDGPVMERLLSADGAVVAIAGVVPPANRRLGAAQGAAGCDQASRPRCGE